MIGVAVGAIEEGQNLNFAIPISQLSRLMARSSSSIDQRMTEKQSQLKAAPGSLEDSANREAIEYARAGSELFQTGLYADTLEAYKKAVALDPNYALALYGLAHTYAALGRNEEAIETHNDRIRMYPRNDTAYHDLVELYENLGRTYEAIETSRNAIKMMPDATLLYTQLASLLDKHDRKQEAEATLNTRALIRRGAERLYDHL